MQTATLHPINQFDTPVFEGGIPIEMVPELLRSGYVSHANYDEMNWIGEHLLD